MFIRNSSNCYCKCVTIRYTKALEVIKKLHKDQAQEIKTYKLKLENLQTLKDAAYKVFVFFPQFLIPFFMKKNNLVLSSKKTLKLVLYLLSIQIKCFTFYARIFFVLGTFKGLVDLKVNRGDFIQRNLSTYLFPSSITFVM